MLAVSRRALDVRALRAASRALASRAASSSGKNYSDTASVGKYSALALALCIAQQGMQSSYQEKEEAPPSGSRSLLHTAPVRCESPLPPSAVGQTDWSAVKKVLLDLLDSEEFMEEPLGPLIVRLAWHSAGTFERSTKTGGSDGATMRFEPEIGWDANAGLAKIQKILEARVKPFCPKGSVIDCLFAIESFVKFDSGPTRLINLTGS